MRRLNKAKEMHNIAKKQRNIYYLNKYRESLIIKLDELAYKIENTKNDKLRSKLEQQFDKRLNLIIQISSGNTSIETH